MTDRYTHLQQQLASVIAHSQLNRVAKGRLEGRKRHLAKRKRDKILDGLVLNMWQRGMSGVQIAKELRGHVGKNTISRIICEARKRGDPHAKIHTYRNGRPAGRLGRKWEQEK